MLEVLENIYIASDRNLVDLRFPVQYVVRPDQDFRGYCGQVASGVIRKGDGVLVLPSLKTTRVKSIVSYDGDLDTAYCPMSVTITLEDEIDVSRGDMIVHQHNIPRIGRHFEAMVVWMSERGMDVSSTYLIKIGAKTERMKVGIVRYKVDINTLSRCSSGALGLNDIGRVALSVFRPVCFDAYEKNRSTGNFIMIDELTNAVVAAGMIVDREPPEQLRIESLSSVDREKNAGKYQVSAEERFELLGQRPCSVWITGSSPSRRKMFAERVEKYLVKSGHACLLIVVGGRVQVLDIDEKCSMACCGDSMIGAISAALNAAGIVVICVPSSTAGSAGGEMSRRMEREGWLTVCLDACPESCVSKSSRCLSLEGSLEDVRSDFQTACCVPVANGHSLSRSADAVAIHILDRSRLPKKNVTIQVPK